VLSTSFGPALEAGNAVKKLPLEIIETSAFTTSPLLSTVSERKVKAETFL
jgi:hypothetical protein